MSQPQSPGAEFTMRHAEPEDAPALAAICRDSFPRTARWQATRATGTRWWAGAIQSRAAEVWVAVRGRAIGGFLLVILDEPLWARQRRTFARTTWQDPLVLATRPAALARILMHRLIAPPAALSANRKVISPGAAPPRLWLELIAVSPEARGQGLGRRLMELCEHRAAILDRPEVRLRVEVDNTGAVALYDREGFETVAVSRRALIMRRDVDPDLLPPREFGLLKQEPVTR